MCVQVDIYPSLVALHGYPIPGDLEGESWVPLLEKGSLSGPSSAGKQRVFSQYPHGLSKNASVHGFKNESGTTMGYSMRTPRECWPRCCPHAASLFLWLDVMTCHVPAQFGGTRNGRRSAATR